MSDIAADDTTALPQTCVRCSGLALIRLVGCCAACIGDMGLNHIGEHAAWKVKVSDAIGVK